MKLINWLKRFKKSEKEKILLNWYSALDQDYGEHGDPDSACMVCYEAIRLGIIDDWDPEEVII